VTLALLWRYRSPLGWGLLLLFGVGMCRARDSSIAREAVVRAEATRLREANAALQQRTDSTDRHQRETVKVVTRVATEYDTLYRERVEHLTDTVWVERTLAKGDTLVRACRTLVTDCTKLVAQKDTLIDNLRAQLGAQTKLSARSKYGLALKLAGAAAVGYGLRAVLHR
jgi:hypothetical protein